MNGRLRISHFFSSDIISNEGRLGKGILIRIKILAVLD